MEIWPGSHQQNISHINNALHFKICVCSVTLITFIYIIHLCFDKCNKDNNQGTDAKMGLKPLLCTFYINYI